MTLRREVLPSDLPFVQAPMAGGPSTPELAAAVASAGGFGFVAGGYLSPTALRDAIEATRALTTRPFGVNLFVPSRPSDPGPIDAYARALQPEADRLGVALGEARWDDDGYPAKLDAVAALRPHLVTFTFGCPSADDVARLHAAGAGGIRVGVTITAADEAAAAEAAGADLLLVQGTEAGGHQGGLDDREPNRTPLLDLLAAVRARTSLPLIGSGGVMDAAGVRAVLDAGAIAAACGTALLCAPEAGTSEVHRDALLAQRFGDTVLTRAFSGRYARGLANRFAREHPDAPRGYPQIHHLTSPLRAAARRAGDPDVPNLWAGTGWRSAHAVPAGEIVRAVAG
jgi:nitronate monooxygenase